MDILRESKRPAEKYAPKEGSEDTALTKAWERADRGTLASLRSPGQG